MKPSKAILFNLLDLMMFTTDTEKYLVLANHWLIIIGLPTSWHCGSCAGLTNTAACFQSPEVATCLSQTTQSSTKPHNMGIRCVPDLSRNCPGREGSKEENWSTHPLKYLVAWNLYSSILSVILVLGTIVSSGRFVWRVSVQHPDCLIAWIPGHFLGKRGRKEACWSEHHSKT